MNNSTHFLFIFYFYISILFAVAIRYDHHTLFRVLIKTDKDADYVRNLSKKYQVNFWTEPTYQFMKEVDFSISPEDKYKLLGDSVKLGLNIYPILENIQSAFDRQSVKPYIRRRQETFDWNNYYRLSDIYEWMRDIANAYPSEIEVFVIGKTYQHRDILAMRMNLGGGLHKPKIMIEGGMHPREWISPAVVTYIIFEIHNAKFAGDSLMKEIAYAFEWLFIPVCNPDGYEYTHTTDRLWRKNRHFHGVDLNRNFDASFTRQETKYVKSETHPGSGAFSELETKGISQFIKNNSQTLMHYYALHSYGQVMIIPYGYTTEHLDNYQEMERITKLAAANIRRKYNTNYTVGTVFDTLGYLAYGASACWVKKTFRIPYVLSIELRDTGTYGFALPADQIIPTGKEALLALKSIINNSKTTEEYGEYVSEVSSNRGAKTTCMRFICFLFDIYFVIIEIF